MHRAATDTSAKPVGRGPREKARVHRAMATATPFGCCRHRRFGLAAGSGHTRFRGTLFKGLADAERSRLRMRKTLAMT